MEKFHGSIAVVTGASSGIGLGIVKKLLETKQLEVVGLSRREMTLTETNFRNLFKMCSHIHITCNLFSLSSSRQISALFWQFSLSLRIEFKVGSSVMSVRQPKLKMLFLK